MINNDPPHVGVSFPSYFPEEFIRDEFVESGKDLKVLLHPEEPQIRASVEWAIPGLVAVFILRSYFDSFLKEAGKDHYQLLKKSVTGLVSKTKDLPVRTLTAQQSIEKTDDEFPMSKAISIHLQLRDGTMLKLMFNNKLGKEEWTQKLNEILDLYEEHYNQWPDDQLSKHLEGLERKKGRELIALINTDTKEWEFYDRTKLVLLIRKQQGNF